MVNSAAGEDRVGAIKALAVSEGAELVRRCRAGDGAAWEEIVQNYSRRIYNLAYRFTSRSDTAEDLTQEVFVRVYRSLDQYDPKQGDLQNWLMRLARNLIIDDTESANEHRTTIRRTTWQTIAITCALVRIPSNRKWNVGSSDSRYRPVSTDCHQT
jgi:RNA polymerase sigma factor, sigma-70 family